MVNNHQHNQLVEPDQSTIPVIDLGAMLDANDKLVVGEELVSICHNVGFFIVTNHGIDPSFIASVFDWMETFFSLPDADKLRIDKRRSRHFRGWEAIGTERTNDRPDIREQIDLWSEWPALDNDVEPEYLRLLGPNQWMPNSILAGQQELIASWFDQLAALGDELLELISLGLGLENDHLLRFFGEQPMSLTKLISYPSTPPGQAGVNAHHDTGFLTILAAGSTPGLQIRTHEGEWVDVPCIKDSFVINLGEMLQAMTGNYLVATPHRVITSSPRLSAGYFHGPSLDARLEPLPLAHSFREAVQQSPHHVEAGFMALASETDAGVGDMESDSVADTYGQQLWNYFSRSYPENMELHYPSEVSQTMRTAPLS